ncbi:GMC oxidoreductase [Kineococcus aurantiacus]|uniref:Choline dehydrogenase-like flavoprotein n=1 Tax=Kineococcus aurantiacus TaxID=37633 RepID=A0A7Y9DJB6_9ACTN|nr:GMC oxidoreductase [Kineococcus aurantiacus]NYD20577.1 choline dehydrogenase-like flavoprotein [Kineococcus aurantiacus]
MTSHTAAADLLIVGGGLMGAAVAARARAGRPGTRIVIVDAGRPIGTVAGAHLHDSAEPDVRETYLQRVEPGVQSLYLGADPTPSLGGSIRDARPGMYNVSAFGSDAAAMPAAAVGLNAGGMGVHWTAATPWPWGAEVFDEDAGAFAADLATAQRLLRVQARPFAPTEVGDRVLQVLDGLFGPVSAPGRHPQAMPMAVAPGRVGPLARTGPNVVLPRLLDGPGDDFEVLTGTVALRLVHDGTRVAGVEVRDTRTGEERTVTAAAVVVAADTFRTPQLLFASGIRPEALGTHLNEHAFLTGQVLVDLPRLGVDLESVPPPLEGEWVVGSHWLPHSGDAQPFHGQIMDRLFVDEAGGRLGYSTGASLYVPTDVDPANRLVFDEDEVDAAGLPRLRVEYRYTAGDLARIEEGRATQRRLCEALGDFEPDRDSALLAPGSSLHWTGTTRSGRHDDGTSVCDPSGRVWGFSNLHLAGGSVVPTPVTANSTLTAVVTAVRAARGTLDALEQETGALVL